VLDKDYPRSILGTLISVSEMARGAAMKKAVSEDEDGRIQIPVRISKSISGTL
jgi:hypothetical protein